MSQPDDLVELGRISGAYGLRGWVTVLPASPDPQALLKSKQWWVSEVISSGTGAQSSVASRAVKPVRPRPDQIRYRELNVLSVKPHADRLVAHFMGIESRELAEKLKGGRVYVSRSKFPGPDEGEYYWVDLEGCEVSNPDGHVFGAVQQVIDHGAHPILVVGDHLIPFVAAYVLDVDLNAKTITVDWQEDY